MPLVFTHTHHDARMPLQLPPSNVVARVIARRSSAALVPGTLSRNSGQKRGSPDPPSHVSPAHICSRRDGLQRAHMNIATPRTRCFLRMSVDITLPPSRLAEVFSGSGGWKTTEAGLLCEQANTGGRVSLSEHGKTSSESSPCLEKASALLSGSSYQSVH